MNVTDEEWQKRWPSFTRKEMACRETDIEGVTESLMDTLQALRDIVGKPFVITSGYRSPKHSVEKAKKSPGAHSKGLAVDIACRGQLAFDIVESATKVGFTGIGISQQGANRFIHLDICREGDIGAPRPWLWSY